MKRFKDLTKPQQTEALAEATLLMCGAILAGLCDNDDVPPEERHFVARMVEKAKREQGAPGTAALKLQTLLPGLTADLGRQQAEAAFYPGPNDCMFFEIAL